MLPSVLEPTARALWALYWQQRGLTPPTLAVSDASLTDTITCSSDAETSGIHGFVAFINEQRLINAIGQLLPTPQHFLIVATLTDPLPQAQSLPPFTLQLTELDFEALLNQTESPSDPAAPPF